MEPISTFAQQNPFQLSHEMFQLYNAALKNAFL